MAVNRRDLAKALKEEHGGTITEHDKWIENFIDVLSRKISEKGRVEIRGFGAFSLNSIKAHTTVDPSSTEDGKKPKKMKVPKTYTVDFRPSGSYKDWLKKEHSKKKKKKKKKAKSEKKNSVK